ARALAATGVGRPIINTLLITPQVVQAIIRNVLAVAGSMNYSTVTTITIYSPSSSGGDFNAATDPYDQFDASGNTLHSAFPLTARNQIPPAETSIGVRLDWTYTPPTG